MKQLTVRLCYKEKNFEFPLEKQTYDYFITNLKKNFSELSIEKINFKYFDFKSQQKINFSTSEEYDIIISLHQGNAPKTIFIFLFNEEKVKKKMLISGSSVCAGAGAINYFGWSQMLQEKLKNSYDISNISIGGTNTIDWKIKMKKQSDFWKSFPTSKPDVILISLSLANEGIYFNIEKYKKQFLEGLREIASIC